MNDQQDAHLNELPGNSSELPGHSFQLPDSSLRTTRPDHYIDFWITISMQLDYLMNLPDRLGTTISDDHEDQTTIDLPIRLTNNYHGLH